MNLDIVYKLAIVISFYMFLIIIVGEIRRRFTNRCAGGCIPNTSGMVCAYCGYRIKRKDAQDMENEK